AKADDAQPDSASPVTAAAMASFMCIFSLLSSAEPLIETVARRDLAGDVDRHGLALPVLHQLLFPQVAVHELLDELVAAELEELHVRLDAPVERHGDPPRPREHVGIFDRHVVLDDVR